MEKKFLTTLATGLLLLGAGGTAYSGPLVSDMTLNGQNADFAYGTFSDNDSSGIGGIISGDAFTLLAKSDADSDIYYSGFEFDVTALGGVTGTFNLSWTGGPVPQSLDFAFVEKASDSYDVYFFDDFLLSTSPSSYSGTYLITFTNGGGKNPDLSHLSVYGRAGEPVAHTPEPATMLLFGAGLGGLAAAARRKKKVC